MKIEWEALRVVLLTLWLALVVGGIAGVMLQGWFESKLRIRFPVVWESLGRPYLFRGTKQSKRYLMKQQYASLEDPELIRRGTLVRGYVIAYTVVLVALSIGFGVMLVLLRYGWLRLVR